MASDIESTDALAGRNFTLLHQHLSTNDDTVASLIEQALQSRGAHVLVDRTPTFSMDWAREIQEAIATSDAVVVVLSEDSMGNEMLGYLVEHARNAAHVNGGRPRIVVVRVLYTGPLDEPFAGILGTQSYYLWEGDWSNDGLLVELLYDLENLPSGEVEPSALPAKGERLTPKLEERVREMEKEAELNRPKLTVPKVLETIGGAVPLNSEFYLPRAADREVEAALDRRDSIILIKGARQMGKTSLLARGLRHARTIEALAVSTDYQKFSATNLENADTLYLSLAESLADQLDLDVLPTDTWDAKRSANVNFERYMRREVLKKLDRPLIWGMDEVDRIFGLQYSSEVFGLFRSWHNERALDPSGPWGNLTMLITYATEAHLFITDMNQSPFNVGTRVGLEDFSPAQVSELNRRYRSPLKNTDEEAHFVRLLGGHPYLVRRGLHELATGQGNLLEFERTADADEGIYGEHLRRILALLALDPELPGIMKGVLEGRRCPSSESFYRLRSAGIVHGNSHNDAHPRCQLYARFLKRHLA